MGFNSATGRWDLRDAGLCWHVSICHHHLHNPPPDFICFDEGVQTICLDVSSWGGTQHQELCLLHKGVNHINLKGDVSAVLTARWVCPQVAKNKLLQVLTLENLQNKIILLSFSCKLQEMQGLYKYTGKSPGLLSPTGSTYTPVQVTVLANAKIWYECNTCKAPKMGQQNVTLLLDNLQFWGNDDEYCDDYSIFWVFFKFVCYFDFSGSIIRTILYNVMLSFVSGEMYHWLLYMCCNEEYVVILPTNTKYSTFYNDQSHLYLHFYVTIWLLPTLRHTPALSTR